MRRVEHPQIELQIAPLIDVCFLLLFFYILTTKPERSESGIPSALPGRVSLEQPLRIPDTQTVRISSEGQVFLNDLAMDNAQSAELVQLRTQLARLKQVANSHKDTPLVLIESAEDTRHQRLVEVLQACAAAGIESVSFESVEKAP